MGTPRDLHDATLLANGKVLVTGGESSFLPVVASSELYDPAAGTFSPTGSMGTPRWDHTAILLPKGKVLVVGGLREGLAGGVLASSELYDPATGTFSPTGSMATPRVSWAILLPNGKVLVAGGFATIATISGRVGPGPTIASSEVYDPATGTFSTTGSMVTARVSPLTLLPNGKVLVTGGWTGSGTALASSELYTP